MCVRGVCVCVAYVCVCVCVMKTKNKQSAHAVFDQISRNKHDIIILSDMNVAKHNTCIVLNVWLVCVCVCVCLYECVCVCGVCLSICL